QDSDILTLHVPLTREGRDKTYHLLELHNLSEMKKDALLINTSRGEVVDNIALRESLEKGLLRGASLDVWEGEPVADPRLIAMADIATPHIAGYSVDGKANATISSVRVVAETLGIPLEHWTPAELPAPEAPVIDLSGLHDSSLDLVARAVRHTYPIAGDDTLFRNGREKFEYLRDNYRIRREFGLYSVRTGDSRAAQIMENLGFKIIK
ncbi:MAG: DUF3410 domain-containing protein, partial [Bacteroidales bacterium]|nr:DUF3410 domain-containing protein [Bacteroidales bacterium]